VAILLLVALGVGLQITWRYAVPQVAQNPSYLLLGERITMTPQPEWIDTDIRAEVIRNSGLADRLSLLDESFASIVADAFALHPWVKSVDHVAKRYPSGVHVDLTFREPVAVVELAAPQGVQLVPIDKHSVHLPVDDVPEIRKRYLPRIGGIVGRPPVGQAWDDPRVQGAADLAVHLAETWEKFHLVDILPSTRPEILDEHRYYVFDLITRGGTRVVWGAAPSDPPPGEDDFAKKLARLKDCIESHGPLDTVRSPAIVDVRQNLSITPRTVKKMDGPRTVQKDSSPGEDSSVVK
jgi:hypothetical protein